MRIILEAQDNASSVFSSVKGNAESAAGGITSSFGAIGGGIGSVIGMLAQLGLAFNSLERMAQPLISLVDLTAKWQDVQAQTTATIKSTGEAAGVTTAQVSALAQAQADLTGKSREYIESAENILLTFRNIGGDILPKTTAAVLDFSTAMHIDANQAALQLGKALNDPIAGMTRLMREGVTFTEAQKETVKQMVETGNAAGAQNLILAEMQKEFGGSAEAAGNTFHGALDKLQNKLKETAEDALTPLLEKGTEFSTWLLEHAIPAIQQFVQNDLIPWAKEADKWFNENILPHLLDFYHLIHDDLLPALKDFWNNDLIPRLKEWGDTWNNDILPVLRELRDRVLPVVQEWIQKLSDFLDQHRQVIADFAIALGLIVVALAGFAVITGVITLIGALLSPLGFATVAIAALVAVALYVHDNWPQIWHEISTTVADIWNGMVDWIGKGANAILGFLGDVVSKIGDFVQMVSKVPVLSGLIGGAGGDVASALQGATGWSVDVESWKKEGVAAPTAELTDSRGRPKQPGGKDTSTPAFVAPEVPPMSGAGAGEFNLGKGAADQPVKDLAKAVSDLNSALKEMNQLTADSAMLQQGANQQWGPATEGLRQMASASNDEAVAAQQRLVDDAQAMQGLTGEAMKAAQAQYDLDKAVASGEVQQAKDDYKAWSDSVKDVTTALKEMNAEQAHANTLLDQSNKLTDLASQNNGEYVQGLINAALAANQGALGSQLTATQAARGAYRATQVPVLPEGAGTAPAAPASVAAAVTYTPEQVAAAAAAATQAVQGMMAPGVAEAAVTAAANILQAPTAITPGLVTQAYGPTSETMEPMIGGVHFHQGLDLGVQPGTQLAAAGAGVVTSVLNQGTEHLGLSVTIDLGSGLTETLGHLDQALVHVGDPVTAGQIIGLSGGEAGSPTRGASTGPHTHIQFAENGATVDPMALFGQAWGGAPAAAPAPALPAIPGYTPGQLPDASALVLPHVTIDNSSREAFIKSFAPLAQALGQQTGLDPAWIIAAAGSESNFGQAGGNELFGIKAQPGQAGASMGTWEMVNGQRVQMPQSFATYASPEDATRGFWDFLQQNPRYAGALQGLQAGGGSQGFFQGINQAGYATNPNWWSDVNNIRQGQVQPLLGGEGGDPTSTTPSYLPGAFPIPQAPPAPLPAGQRQAAINAAQAGVAGADTTAAGDAATANQLYQQALAARAEHISQLNSLGGQITTALKARYDEQEAIVVGSLNDEKDFVKGHYKTLEEDARNAADTDIKALQKTAATRIATLQDEAKQAEKVWGDLRDKQLKDLQTDEDKQQLALQAGEDKKLKVLSDARDKALADLQKTSDTHLSLLSDANDKELQIISDRRDKEIQAAVDAANVKKDLLSKQEQDQLDSLSKSTNDQIAALQAQIDAPAIKRAADEKARLQASLLTTTGAEHDKIQQQLDAIAEAENKAKLQGQIADLRAAASEQAKTIQAGFAEQQKALATALADQQKTIQQGAQSATKTQQESYAEQLKSYRELIAGQTKAIQEKYAGDVKTAGEAYAKQKKDLTEHFADERKQVQDAYAGHVADVQKSVKDQTTAINDQLATDITNRRKALQTQIDDLERNQAAELKLIDDHITAVKEYYKQQTSTYHLQAEARLLMTGDNEQAIVDLLNSYAPDWASAGQSLGEQMVAGVSTSGLPEYVHDILTGKDPKAPTPTPPPVTAGHPGITPVAPGGISNLAVPGAAATPATLAIPIPHVPGANPASQHEALSERAPGAGATGNTTNITFDMRGVTMTGSPADNEAMIKRVVREALSEQAGHGATLAGVTTH